MDNQAIKDALLAANTELVEKIGKQPYFGLKLILDDVFWSVGGAYPDSNMRDRIQGPRCDTLEDALSGVMDSIRAMTPVEEQNLRTFQKKVAEAIDFGTEHGIEGKWLNPLVETARGLAENAITHQKNEANQ